MFLICLLFLSILIFSNVIKYRTKQKYLNYSRLINLKSLYGVAKGSYSFVKENKTLETLKYLDDNMKLEDGDVDNAINLIQCCIKNCQLLQGDDMVHLRKYYDYFRAYAFTYARSEKERSHLILIYGTIDHIIQ